MYECEDDLDVLNDISEDDLLDDCDYEFEEFDNYKAELNMKGHRFRFVPESEGIGE